MARRPDGSVYVTEAQRKASETYQARKLEQAQAREERKQARLKRSPQQQLDLLNERLGVGRGAIKERVRLQQEIALQKASKKQ